MKTITISESLFVDLVSVAVDYFAMEDMYLPSHWEEEIQEVGGDLFIRQVIEDEE